MSELERNFLKFSTKRVIDKPVMAENRLKRKAIVDDGIIRNAHEEANYLKNRMLNVLQSSINIIKDGNNDVEGGAYSKVTEGIYKKANQYQSNLTQKRLQGMTEGPAVQFVDENKLTPEETGKENEINNLLTKLEASISNLNLTSGTVTNMNDIYQILSSYAYAIKISDVQGYIEKFDKIISFLQSKLVKSKVNKKELQIADTLITVSVDCKNVLKTMLQYPNATVSEKRIILQQNQSSSFNKLTEKLGNRIDEENVDTEPAKETIKQFLKSKVRKTGKLLTVRDVDAITRPVAGKSQEQIFEEISAIEQMEPAIPGSKTYLERQVDLLRLVNSVEVDEETKEELADQRKELKDDIIKYSTQNQALNDFDEGLKTIEKDFKDAKREALRKSKLEAMKKVTKEGRYVDEEQRTKFITTLTKQIYGREEKRLKDMYLIQVQQLKNEKKEFEKVQSEDYPERQVLKQFIKSKEDDIADEQFKRQELEQEIKRGERDLRRRQVEEQILDDPRVLDKRKKRAIEKLKDNIDVGMLNRLRYAKDDMQSVQDYDANVIRLTEQAQANRAEKKRLYEMKEVDFWKEFGDLRNDEDGKPRKLDDARRILVSQMPDTTINPRPKFQKDYFKPKADRFVEGAPIPESRTEEQIEEAMDKSAEELLEDLKKVREKLKDKKSLRPGEYNRLRRTETLLYREAVRASAEQAKNMLDRKRAELEGSLQYFDEALKGKTLTKAKQYASIRDRTKIENAIDENEEAMKEVVEDEDEFNEMAEKLDEAETFVAEAESKPETTPQKPKETEEEYQKRILAEQIERERRIKLAKDVAEKVATGAVAVGKTLLGWTGVGLVGAFKGTIGAVKGVYRGTKLVKGLIDDFNKPVELPDDVKRQVRYVGSPNFDYKDTKSVSSLRSSLRSRTSLPEPVPAPAPALSSSKSTTSSTKSKPAPAPAPARAQAMPVPAPAPAPLSASYAPATAQAQATVAAQFEPEPMPSTEDIEKEARRQARREKKALAEAQEAENERIKELSVRDRRKEAERAEKAAKAKAKEEEEPAPAPAPAKAKAKAPAEIYREVILNKNGDIGRVKMVRGIGGFLIPENSKDWSKYCRKLDETKEGQEEIKRIERYFNYTPQATTGRERIYTSLGEKLYEKKKK